MAVTQATDDNFNEIISSNDKVIVKYYAGWCGSCKLFAPKFRRLSNTEEFEGVTFIEVNAEENEAARKAAGVDNLPFIATFANGSLKTGNATSKEDVVVGMIKDLQS